ITSLSATKVEHVNEDYSTYTIEFVDEGEYEVKVNAINQATAANKAIAFEIDKTVPTITISGVSDGQTITTQPTIIYSSQDTVSATLAKDGGAAQAIGSNYKVTENGSYAFVVSAVDNAGNTNVRSINFTVNISVVNPGGGGGGVVPAPIPVPVTDLPVVEPIEETKVIGIEDKVIFEEVQITMDLTETVMTVGTEITVKSYEKTSDAEGLSLSVENGMIIKIASEIYEFNASEEFEGQIEITIPYDPTKVTDPKKLTVSTYDEKLGKWKLIGGKVNTTDHTITFKTTHFSYYTILEGTKTFKDLGGFSWAKDVINILASRGAISGYNVDSFKPGNLVTRAEFASILVKALNMEEGENTVQFKDVHGEWYADVIAIAASNNVMSGYNGYANPNAYITREEMVVMIMNAYVIEMNLDNIDDTICTFDDKNTISNWSMNSVVNAAELGIISGKGNNQFAPKDNSTRAEAATVVYNLMVNFGIFE
ncbi:MAG: S-layer homology domain-containing protein, partial [Vallitaleaceae bacterium]|nr:S-layer homology domain-containing protein [Vallitaleaceae bacterium]